MTLFRQEITFYKLFSGVCGLFYHVTEMSKKMTVNCLHLIKENGFGKKRYKIGN